MLEVFLIALWLPQAALIALAIFNIHRLPYEPPEE
jgi:hypothetical protein